MEIYSIVENETINRRGKINILINSDDIRKSNKNPVIAPAKPLMKNIIIS
jgi:hypothetical protein